MSPAERALAAYTKAVAEKDVELLVGLFDEQVLLFDVWDQWSISGKAAWRSAVEEWLGSLGSDRVLVEFETVQETVSDGLVCASAFVTYTAFSLDGTRLRSHKERQTWVLSLKEEGWRVVHCHNSVPFGMETGKPLSRE